MNPLTILRATFFLLCGFLVAVAQAPDTKQRDVYRRIKAHLDATPAIDTHEHLPPFELIRGRVETERGRGMTLHTLWQSSYYTWFNPLTPWPRPTDSAGKCAGAFSVAQGQTLEAQVREADSGGEVIELHAAVLLKG